MSVKYKAGSFEYRGEFVRSILCEMLSVPNKPFLLINVDKVYSSSDDAAILAKTDIDSSFAYAKIGKFKSIDHALSAMGYQKYEEE
jgi:hypothetical protein